MDLRRALVIPVVCGLTTGCGMDCSPVAFFAVRVEVRDASGAPLQPDVVEYSVDGEEQPSVDCVAEPSLCADGSVHLGVELEGSYEIVVRRGADEARASVIVEQGDCHVSTEQVTVT